MLEAFYVRTPNKESPLSHEKRGFGVRGTKRVYFKRLMM
jgi:hypothetical protein